MVTPYFGNEDLRSATRPEQPYPCITPGTRTYTGCIGTTVCRASGRLSCCVFGRWADARQPIAFTNLPGEGPRFIERSYRHG